MTKTSHLRGNEFETRVLPPCLLVDDVLNFRVHLCERGIQDFILSAVMSIRTDIRLREIEAYGDVKGCRRRAWGTSTPKSIAR